MLLFRLVWSVKLGSNVSLVRLLVVDILAAARRSLMVVEMNNFALRYEVLL